MLGIGSAGPEGASPDDIKGWSSTQVGAPALPGGATDSSTFLVVLLTACGRRSCCQAGQPSDLLLHSKHTPVWLRHLSASRPQLVAFLEKLAELRAMQPLHPAITRK